MLFRSQATRDILLAHVPRTEVVKFADAHRLWDARRSLFFKPVAGFGSRAAYRGDKLTKRVWQDILAGDYVAQAIVTPGERVIDGTDMRATGMPAETAAATRAMKYDLRAYTYDGAVQWVAARLYQGQTTNFRTPGGGFAPVYSSADVAGASAQVCTSAGGADGSHASYIFLLDESSGVHPVPHALYVALARGEACRCRGACEQKPDAMPVLPDALLSARDGRNRMPVERHKLAASRRLGFRPCLDEAAGHGHLIQEARELDHALARHAQRGAAVREGRDEN